MPSANPEEMLGETSPDELPAESPPPAANYRPADVEGIACAHCSKFTFTGAAEDENGDPVPVGVCEQWEANVRGDYVSDAFADPTPPIDELDQGEDWEFAGETKQFVEVHLADTNQEEKEGFVIKEVLRTGEWPGIPTSGGVLPKTLRVVRDGKSSPVEGTIALSEVVENFKAQAIPRVQIPLSDEDRKEHKNNTRVNTGFVRDLWIEDKEDGDSRLVAKMEFTEPDVRDKVLRGTYADVSCGIPWEVVSKGHRFGACLEHVAITNKPFIDNLGPFLAASEDETDVEISHFGDKDSVDGVQTSDGTELREENPEHDEKEKNAEFSFEQIKNAANSALISQLNLSGDYSVTDLTTSTATVSNSVAGTSWIVPFQTSTAGTDFNITLGGINEWTTIEREEKDDAPVENPTAPRGSSDEDGLEAARRLRELRLSEPVDNHDEGGNMPLSREELDRLELSDDARAALQSVLDENAQLSARTREQDAEKRIDELKDLGLSERPGALKLYRQVYLSDDGGPAVVLLSDEGQKQERLTALEILDRFIDGVKGSDDKVHLSDQALVSGNDNPPPADAEEENESFEDRLARQKQALGV